MSRRFFWQMVVSLLCVNLLAFTAGHALSTRMNHALTSIDEDDQHRLMELARQAEALFIDQELMTLQQLTAQIQAEYGVWSAVRDRSGTLHSHKTMPADLHETFDFRRKVTAPVHGFFTKVVIGVPFAQGGAFVMALPPQMYPQSNIQLAHTLLTLVLPSLALLGFCWLLYRYLMRPLEVLNQSTQALASGRLDTRARQQLPSGRHDEFTQMADSFDEMATQIQRLVTTQRQLLGDMSHELRTPLTRIGLALEQGASGDAHMALQLPRIEGELRLMDELIEDALTLAWLDDQPTLRRQDRLDLAQLLNVIADDAAFEFPQHRISLDYVGELWLQTHQRLLSHSIENVLRNALKYSPPGSQVSIGCQYSDRRYLVSIRDQGPGVPEQHLENIFKPFYRLDKARSHKVAGFGLGLALVRRQITAIGGLVQAHNHRDGGLNVLIQIPIDTDISLKM